MKKKIAILHAQVPFVTGGAELMVNSLKANLISRGFEAEIIALPLNGIQKILYMTICLHGGCWI